MERIGRNDTGAAVEDVQQKLVQLGYLPNDGVSGTFDEATEHAVEAFCAAEGLPSQKHIDDKVWAGLVDASFSLGDRTLFLHMPYFHGNDVRELQSALGSLGFSCGSDGIFGVHTESALRRFQTNMGLPTDGIAGAFTYRAINNLRHSWEGKHGPQVETHMGFARASDVIERNPLCLFGTSEFTRSVAARMSNLALATNPASKILSADSLLVAPDEHMLLVQILVGDQMGGNVPVVSFEDESTLALRLQSAIRVASATPPRIAISLPSETWEDAGAGRSAQHYAITLLDGLCAALSAVNER